MKIISVDQLPSGWLDAEATSKVLLAGTIDDYSHARSDLEEAVKILGRTDIAWTCTHRSDGPGAIIIFIAEADGKILLDECHMNAKWKDC